MALCVIHNSLCLHIYVYIIYYNILYIYIYINLSQPIDLIKADIETIKAKFILYNTRISRH